MVDVFDGSPKVVWKAVNSCMAILNGSRGGIELPDGDRQKIYNTHIKRYYQKFDAEAPPLKQFSDIIAELQENGLEYDEEGILAKKEEESGKLTEKHVKAILEETGLTEEEAFELLKNPPHEVDKKVLAKNLVEERLMYLAGKTWK
jgi:hypothetical protein